MASKPLWKRIASPILGAVMTLLHIIPALLFALKVKLGYIKGRYLDFVPREDDIFVASYPRSGTTLIQMIVYQLTTDGKLDFTHISERIPWFERAFAYGKSFEQMASPRIFKTHLRYGSVPKRPCRSIYVARNGKDVAVSYFHFYQSHMKYRGDFRGFFQRFLRGKLLYGSWFKHVASWWKNREDPNVLFITYEELVGDMESSIRKIIAFCGLTVSEEHLQRTLETCSFESMKKHEEKFDHRTQVILDSGMQANSFLRKGGVGGWREDFTPQEEAVFDENYQRELGGLGLDLRFQPDTHRAALKSGSFVNEKKRAAGI
ncbi:MAG TPA: sulfotransferase domain-containing protein [Pyrinomonadaceae bacterium]|jgi:hypothetical protein